MEGEIRGFRKKGGEPKRNSPTQVNRTGSFRSIKGIESGFFHFILPPSLSKRKISPISLKISKKKDEQKDEGSSSLLL